MYKNAVFNPPGNGELLQEGVYQKILLKLTTQTHTQHLHKHKPRIYTHLTHTHSESNDQVC